MRVVATKDWIKGALAVAVLAHAGAQSTKPAAPQSSAAAMQQSSSAQALVEKMVANEDQEAAHKGHFSYLSKERSDRTGGHLWTERVAETNAGKIKMLIAEDGQTLAGSRASGEKVRLEEIAAHPDEFQKREQARRNDEEHAKELLDLLPKAFVLEKMRPEGEYVRIDFRPRPDYAPRSLEERVLHSMQGSLLVQPKLARLRSIEGRLPEDVNIGFGLVATIRAGSSFDTTRELVPGGEWKTHTLNTDITGRAIFFKSIGKKEHAEHNDFRQIPMDLSVAQAVALLQKQGS